MKADTKKPTAIEATGYIAGACYGIARSVLRGHFRVLVLVTLGLLGWTFFIGTALLQILVLYVAIVALIFGHALLRKPAA
ncbi:MAG TPA: hypothetical protein VF430_06300 [Verrucomicrobiae bacterium]|jgi:hypothetical protein